MTRDYLFNSTSIETIRLPVLSSAGGFGELPQLFLAFGGGDTPFAVNGSKVAVSNRLSPLNLQANISELWVKGLIPYAFGNDSALRLIHDGEYADFDGFESLSELDDVVLGFVSLDYAEKLSSASKDTLNYHYCYGSLDLEPRVINQAIPIFQYGCSQLTAVTSIYSSLR